MSPISIYTCDAIVKAFTGEIGQIDPSPPVFKCARGYQSGLHQVFYVNGHYTGATYLFYDGHAGIDYRAPFGTQVYAATSGTLRYPTLNDLKRQKITIGSDPDVLGALELDPGNGYKIYYLHLSTHPRSLSVHLTQDLTGQDFVATQTGTPGSSKFGALAKVSPLSISGQITTGSNKQPLAGATVILQGRTETLSQCVSLTQTTDKNGLYRFSNLVAGYFQLRPSMSGYTFAPVVTQIIVPDSPTGVPVNAGEPIGLSGNAGPCFPPHLHFEVQHATPPAVESSTGFSFVQVDPYGWDNSVPILKV